MRAKTGFSIITAMLLAVTVALSAPEGQKVGDVLFVRGEAWLIRGGERSALTPRSAIRGGDIVKTGVSGGVSVRMDDGGYVMEIKPRSEFMFDEPGAEAEKISSGMLNVGVVYVRHRSRDIGKKRKKDYYYLQVQTPSAVAGVRGTEFAVAVAPGGNGLVAVKDGQVSVGKDGGDEITLKMRQKLEIPAEEGEISEKGISDYFPETYSVEQWFETARKRALENVGPLTRRITASLRGNILKADKLAEEIAELAARITREARLAEKNRLRGQTIYYEQHRKEVERLFPVLKTRVRAFIRLDNRIRRRGRMLVWLLEQAAESDSPASPVAKKLIKKRLSAFREFESRLEKLRERRREILREKIPEMKQAGGALLR